MSNWEGFFLAEVGASAALAGLIFVGISINLKEILANKLFPPIASAALIQLVEVLVVSSLMLVPEQTWRMAGLEVTLIGLVCWFIMIGIVITQTTRMREQVPAAHRFGHTLTYVLLSQVATLPFLIGGIMMAKGFETGAYWLVPGILSSMVFSLYMAWVLMIEIRR